MATITISQAKIVRNAYGLPSIIRGGAERPNIKESASQTYAAGAPVYFDTNGTIAAAAASSNKVGLVAGFALAAATGVTGAAVRYRAIQPGDIILCNLKGTTTTVTALTQKGKGGTTFGGASGPPLTLFDLSSGNLVANPDGTTTTQVFADTITYLYGIIEDLYTVANGYNDGDAVGDTNGRLLIRIPDQPCLQR